MRVFLTWLRDKTGRLVTAFGGLLALLDLDISPMKDTLESLMSHKDVQFITLALFVGSYLRHQYIASQHLKVTA